MLFTVQLLSHSWDCCTQTETRESRIIVMTVISFSMHKLFLPAGGAGAHREKGLNPRRQKPDTRTSEYIAARRDEL